MLPSDSWVYERADRRSPLMHLTTPNGLASVPANADTELLVAMISETARQVGGTIRVTRD